MDPITFRPCRPEDADMAVPLIYSSGPAAFDYVFCDRAPDQALAFLKAAFIRGTSEFGYPQHTAALHNGRLVGVGAVRTARQNTEFTLAALRAICAFYPPLAAARIIWRGLKTEQIIRPPQVGVGVVYHLGVDTEFRGRGIGRRLLDHLLDKVRAQKATTAALDVAATNPRAKALYERQGFVARQTRAGALESRYGRVVDHTYMTQELNRTTEPDQLNATL